jgi:hypothetical protein
MFQTKNPTKDVGQAIVDKEEHSLIVILYPLPQEDQEKFYSKLNSLRDEDSKLGTSGAMITAVSPS